MRIIKLRYPKYILATIFVFSFFNPSVVLSQENNKELKNIPFSSHVQNIEAKIDSLLSQLTLEEKVAMCYAQSKFSTPGVPRLGIPKVRMSDGPHGVRREILIDIADLKYYEESISNWRLEKGEYMIYVGNASDNIVKKLKISID